MKHQQQGYNECYLATTAMLTDRTIAEVKQACGICCWPTKALCDWDKVSALIGIDYQNDLRPSFVRQIVRSGQFTEPQNPAACSEEPDLTGTGLLILRVGDGPSTHAMAYENGLVYDPDYPEIETWEECYKRRPKYMILVNRKVTIKGKTD